MLPLLDADRLTITATFVECAALWTQDEAVYLNVWDPCRLDLYCSHRRRLPGDIRLAGHLDFTDAGGRNWIQVVDWSAPPHPPSLHPGTIARWEQALERHLLTWWSSLSHPRFHWLHANNHVLLR
jgi:hypothetical protein